MRAALISIVGQPQDGEGNGGARLAGKSLAQRQLAFALAAGAEQIVLQGDDTSQDAIEVRQVAERGGAKVIAISDGHGLLGVVRAADHLLVIAPGLLPEAPSALEMLGKGSSLLVLPASVGIPAGFERIDLERAWAGVLVIQGGLVERLAELPPDIEPSSALLRIALQAQVAERRLPETVLVDGSWVLLKSPADLAVAEGAWLKRNLPRGPGNRPTRWIAARALRALSTKLLEKSRAAGMIAAGSAVALLGGIGAAFFGWSTAGFLIVALGALGKELFSGLARLTIAPFDRAGRMRTLAVALGILIDLALASVAVLAIGQDWLHSLFPPLVLVGLLRALRPERRPGPSALVGDRMLLAFVLAVSSAFGFTEVVVMALALGLIAMETAQTLTRRG